jgi:antitoxin CcdA
MTQPPPQPAKRKVSLTLDADLVADLVAVAEAGGENLSAQVNTIIRDDVARRRRWRALGAMLARFDEEEGPLDTPEDEAEIARYVRLLGGPGDGVRPSADGGPV